MFDEPNSSLDLQQILYPNTVMTKLLILESHSAPVQSQFEIEVIYNSFNREIDITDSINNAIGSLLNSTATLQVQIFNFEDERYQELGIYPFQERLFLRGCYVEFSILKIRVLDEKKEEIEGYKPKKGGERCIKDIIKLVAQWRKIYLSKDKKITLEEAAIEVGVPKKTLDDYYYFLKTAQKYQFEFQPNFNKPFRALRKFVQQNSEKKQKNIAPVMAILEKYHPK